MTARQPSRRAMIAAVAATAAAATVPAIAAQASSSRPSMGELIEAHRAALEACNEGVGVVEELEEKLKAMPSIYVPITVLGASGESGSAMYLGEVDADTIRAEICAQHDQMLKRYCGSASALMVPGYMPAMRQAVATSRRKALRGLRAAVAQVECRRVSIGLAEAQAKLDTAFDTERRAALAVLMARPADAAETAAKADYVAARLNYNQIGCDHLLIADMLDALCEVAA